MTQQQDDILTDGEVTLADLENSDHPVLARIRERLLGTQANAAKPHSSHSSSPNGKGHTSYVNGRFEDEGQ